MVKFSLIGAGRIAHRHAEHIIKNGELVAVCDNNPAALESFANDFPNVKKFYVINDLLENDFESDVINICSPNGFHCEHAIKCLQAGKHVVVEKPMALKTIDCHKMISVAKKFHRHLFVVKQNRFNPPIIKLKEVLDRNLLGKIYSAQLNCFWNRDKKYFNNSDWKGTVDLDGGILYTQFSHFIDLFLWVLGKPKAVRAYANNFHHRETIEFDDTITAIASFESGVIGTMNFTINSFNKNMEGSITLFGEKGTIKVGGQYLNELEYQNIDFYKIDDIPMGNPANNYGDYQGSMSNHDKIIENVLDVIDRNGTIAVDGNEAIKTVDFIEKIYASIEREEFMLNSNHKMIFGKSGIDILKETPSVKIVRP
ncbi:Gfo/Idh/MocA family protein [Flavisolibacter ginsengisoli]|jgi:predicted dehydrogenase|uniref:Predicted dehydrogenase n=1 Tax=Flavisolibacter ginsengisoli DSM 18119 TaxID=1121884 RepID=A0A1M5B969_9BACT|nr:Gfo/Idh/MocA family oxidoreductase [Flavisolibacter ginsengisoli]SHF39101.1 Predicted dehydrogenase [Flavisolibacter ginsengisoli DSM 18119]